MSNKVKKMDAKEFRTMGLLAEINRTFLHPLGLALEVMINDDGTETIGGIWDYREDPEGIIYQPFPEEQVKKAKEFINKKHQERYEALGYIFQEGGGNE